MILSIHQPQYIPWTPYFAKIEKSERFIILDSVDFQKNGLQNRNKIKTAQGGIWLTVPVKQKLGQKIAEVEINNSVNWRKKHWDTIQQNYRKADNFSRYSEDIEEFYSREWNKLVDFNMHVLKKMLLWMNINTEIMYSSTLGVDGRGSELILNLCLKVGAKKYISGTGGKNYLDEHAFRDAGIEIVYMPPELPVGYPQQHLKAGFVNDLSALDLMLNCGDGWRSYMNCL